MFPCIPSHHGDCSVSGIRNIGVQFGGGRYFSKLKQMWKYSAVCF